MYGNFSDCEGLARFASERASAHWNNKRAFVDSFAVFVDMADRSVTTANQLWPGGGAIRGVDRPVYLQQDLYGHDSGFLPMYRDKDKGGKADQAHHFAAYFQLGYNTNAAVGVLAAIVRDLDNPGDITLGNKAVAIALKLANPTRTFGELPTR